MEEDDLWSLVCGSFHMAKLFEMYPFSMFLYLFGTVAFLNLCTLWSTTQLLDSSFHMIFGVLDFLLYTHLESILVSSKCTTRFLHEICKSIQINVWMYVVTILNCLPFSFVGCHDYIPQICFKGFLFLLKKSNNLLSFSKENELSFYI